MGISAWQILVVVVLIVLLFGRGKISDLMADLAKGIKSFKKGLSDEDEGGPPKTIPEGSETPAQPAQPAAEAPRREDSPVEG